MIGYIYIFKNLVNSKCYIGQTRQKIKYRYQQHLRANDTYPLHEAIKKYGIEQFSFEIIETINKNNKEELVQELNNLEISYIKQYNSLAPNGYNIEKGGVGKIPNKYTPSLLKELLQINPDIVDQPIINKINHQEYKSIIEAFIDSKQDSFTNFYYDLCYNFSGNYIFKYPKTIKFPGEVFPKDATIQDILDDKAIRYVAGIYIDTNKRVIQDIENKQVNLLTLQKKLIVLFEERKKLLKEYKELLEKLALKDIKENKKLEDFILD